MSNKIQPDIPPHEAVKASASLDPTSLTGALEALTTWSPQTSFGSSPAPPGAISLSNIVPAAVAPRRSPLGPPVDSLQECAVSSSKNLLPADPEDAEEGAGEEAVSPSLMEFIASHAPSSCRPCRFGHAYHSLDMLYMREPHQTHSPSMLTSTTRTGTTLFPSGWPT